MVVVRAVVARAAVVRVEAARGVVGRGAVATCSRPHSSSVRSAQAAHEISAGACIAGWATAASSEIRSSRSAASSARTHRSARPPSAAEALTPRR